MRNFIAFDIGGTLIKYGVLDENGGIIYKSETLTDAHLGGKEVIRKVKEIGDNLLANHDISGICISTAGQVDSRKGTILYASSLIPEYTGMPVKQELEEYFQLPVAVENDVNCVGLAESWIGKGKNTKSMFCLTIGTGIGGSYVIDNKLHTGHSFSGGEIGYIPMEGIQFQDLASTRNLIKNVAKRKGISEEEINGKKIFELAITGDEICIEEINRLVYYLSKGIAIIAYMMNPEMIVIGGGITYQKEYLYPIILEQLKKDLLPTILEKTKIEIASNLNNAGMIGALRHFLLEESIQPFNRITTMIESKKHKLTKGEKNIADYIIMNLSDVPNHTISELAKKINVSESMITRFCQKLEIGSYSKLKLMAKEAIIGTRLHDKNEVTSLVKTRDEYLTVLSKIDTLNLATNLSKLGSLLSTSNRIVLYASEELEYITKQLKYKLMEFKIPVEVFTNQFQMESSIHLLDEHSVVIGISSSGFNQHIMRLFDTAKKLGSILIGITSQQDSPISECADMSFFVPATEDGRKDSAIEISILYLVDVILNELQTESTNVINL
ncbi:ROK family protein [Paucisalibacillus sp. EB02]|uniref:ROK family protein n=1 Tax=Paucisalibacillus sp. EB02 TaxID=1347087 RepID=UPI0004AD7455|nr:ROK family protein [Paucisalibacillus sp. EB02]